MRFFNYESAFSQMLVKFANIIFLTFLWYVFCIPLVTIGASTGAFYYTIEKNIKKNRGYVWNTFWESFKGNFRQSAGVTVIFLLAEAVFYFDFIIMRYFLSEGNSVGNAYVFFIIVMLLILSYFLWTFISIARFDNSLRNILKNALVLMFGHPGTTLYMILMVAFAALAIYIIPALFILMPAVAAWLISFPVEKAFGREAAIES